MPISSLMKTDLQKIVKSLIFWKKIVFTFGSLYYGFSSSECKVLSLKLKSFFFTLKGEDVFSKFRVKGIERKK